MASQTSRPAWAGAAAALVLALVIGVAAAALHPQGAPTAPPATLSAPTPTLDAVISDAVPAPNPTKATNAPSASTPVQAHPKATPSKDKESQ